MTTMNGSLRCGDAMTAERIKNDHGQIMAWLQEGERDASCLPDHLKKFVIDERLHSFGWDCDVSINPREDAFVLTLGDINREADPDVTAAFLLCMLEHYSETTHPRAELTYTYEDDVQGAAFFIDRGYPDPAHKIRCASLDNLAREFMETGSVPVCTQ